MFRTPRSLAALGAIVVFALVPLYGDPRQSPVTHPEWARMVLRGLELEDSLEFSRQASDVFSSLSWRTSLAYPAEEYTRAHGVAVREQGDRRHLAVTDPLGGEAAYQLSVVRPGEYRVRLRMSGTAAAPVWTEISRRGEAGAIDTFGVPVPEESTWVDVGATYLNPGTYDASVLLPEGCDLEWVELAPPCLNPIEPIGGWRSAANAHVYDVAVTTLQALDMEYELPPAEVAHEFAGSEFVETNNPEPMLAAATDTIQAQWLRAGGRGLEAILTFEIPREGLYTVSALTDSKGGQSWTADGCHRVVTCPSTDGVRWWPILTNRFDAGRHSLAVRLAPGAVMQRVSVVRKKDSPEDYLAVLRRLGLDLGEPGQITRPLAVEAMEFIEQKRREVWGSLCLDIPAIQPLTGGPQIAGAPTSIQGPGVPPPFGGDPPTPGGGNPLTPPGPTGFPPGLEPPPVTQPPATPVIP